MRKLIYDIGANTGSDIPYYIMQSDVVVAIEANPILCKEIREQYAEYVSDNRLTVENVVAVAALESAVVDFYIHRTEHVLSQMTPPAANELTHFTHQCLPARAIVDLISQHGNPYYIKIDVEGADAALLRAIFAAGIRPPYISAECLSIEVFQVLLEHGGYRAFKLIEGSAVSQDYTNRSVVNHATQQAVPYSFPPHSAGPFGEDVDGPWMSPENFLRQLAFSGFGWKDIHATNVHPANPCAAPNILKHLDRLVSRKDLARYICGRISRDIARGVTRVSKALWHTSASQSIKHG
jgi:FkbM family methyltransferase